MAISVRAAGTWAPESDTGNTTILVEIPDGYEAGDLGIIVATWKLYQTTGAINESWTEITDIAGGSTSGSSNVGSVRHYVAYKVLGASESDPTITTSAFVYPGLRVCIVLQKDSGGDWAVQKLSDAVETSEQDFSHAITTTAAISIGDLVFALTGVGDESAAFTRATDAISGGPSWSGNVVEYPADHGSTTAAYDVAADLIYRVASSAVASGETITVTGSLSASERCSSSLFAVRAAAAAVVGRSQAIIIG